MSAEIVRVEVLRAIRRGGAPAAAESEAEVHLETVQLVRMDRDLVARAARIGPPDLRTLDALHLAAALAITPPPEVFLCYDRRLARAARLHGLRVLAPGAEEVDEP